MYNKKALPTLMTVITCLTAVFLLAACSGDSEFKDPSTLCETNTSAEEETMTATPEITDERILEVRNKYRPLIRRQPNYLGSGVGYLMDENGEPTETSGIVIGVTKKVDQGTLSPEDRIPDCLEGVPVQILERGPIKLLSESPEDTDEEETNEQN